MNYKPKQYSYFLFVFIFTIYTSLLMYYSYFEETIFIVKALGGLILFLLIFYHLLLKKRFYFNKVSLILLIFPILNIPASIYCMNYQSWKAGFFTLFQLAVYYLLGINIIKDKKHKIIFIITILIFNLFFSLTHNKTILGRYAGVTGNANQFGITMAIGVILSIYLTIITRNKVLKFIFIAVGLMYFNLLIKSYSRQSILSFIIALNVSFIFYILYNSRRKYLYNVVIILLFISISYISYNIINYYIRVNPRFSLSNIAESSREREDLILSGIRMFFKYPIFGVGFHNYSYYVSKFSSVFYYAGYAHNDYIEIASTTGIVGFIAYVLIYYLNIKNIFRLGVNEKLLGIMLIAFFLVDNYFKPNYYNKIFYLSMIIIAFHKGESEKKKE